MSSRFSFLTSRVVRFVTALQARGLSPEEILRRTSKEIVPQVQEYVTLALLSPHAGVSCRRVSFASGVEDCPSTHYRWIAECLFQPAYEAAKWYSDLKNRSELAANPLRATWLDLMGWVRQFLQTEIVAQAVREAFKRSAASVLYASRYAMTPFVMRQGGLQQIGWKSPSCPSSCWREIGRELATEVDILYLYGTLEEMEQEARQAERIYGREYRGDHVRYVLGNTSWEGIDEPANFTGAITLSLYCLKPGEYLAPPSDRRRTRGSTLVVVETQRPGCETPPGFLQVCVYMYRPEGMTKENWQDKEREDRRHRDALRLALQEMQDAKGDPGVVSELGCVDPWCTLVWDDAGPTEDGGSTTAVSYRLCVKHECYCVRSGGLLVRAAATSMVVGSMAQVRSDPATVADIGGGEWQPEWTIRAHLGLS